jgi:hypothetical protein
LALAAPLLEHALEWSGRALGFVVLAPVFTLRVYDFEPSTNDVGLLGRHQYVTYEPLECTHKLN